MVEAAIPVSRQTPADQPGGLRRRLLIYGSRPARRGPPPLADGKNPSAERKEEKQALRLAGELETFIFPKVGNKRIGQITRSEHRSEGASGKFPDASREAVDGSHLACTTDEWKRTVAMLKCILENRATAPFDRMRILVPPH